MNLRRIAPGLLLALLLGLGAATARAHGESVDYWRAQLRSPDPAARVAAATGIALSGNAGAPGVPDLILVLDDEDAHVRQAAVHAIMDIGSPAAAAAIPLAHRLALETEPTILQLLARALIRLGSHARPALPAVIGALRAPEPTARRQACNVLGSQGIAPQEVVDALVQTMVRDPDTRVRGAARAALKELGVDLSKHVDALLLALQDDSPDVRENAADWLGETRPRPVEGVDALVTTLFTDESLRVREAAERALRDMGSDASSAVPRLLEALRDGSRDQREAAASVLGSVSTADDRELNALVSTSVADRELSVRLAARGSLVRLARTSPEIFDRFVEVAGMPGPAERRAAIIDTLGRLGEVAAPAVPNLLIALREGTEQVREGAAAALGRIGAPASDALLPLRRAASWDRSQRVRDAATRGIKGIRRSIERHAEGPELEPEPSVKGAPEGAAEAEEPAGADEPKPDGASSGR